MKKKTKTSLSKEQLWVRERFLFKGHITNAVNQFENMILAGGTLPIESRRLTLAVNHLQEILKDFPASQGESKKQFIRMK
jgi:hypothetical protein